MNSNESGRKPQYAVSGRAARMRRRKRKRIALFASFALIILLLTISAVLLALELADVVAKNKTPDESSDNPSVTTPPPAGEEKLNYIISQSTYHTTEGALILVNNDHEYTFPSSTSRLMNIYDTRPKDSTGKSIYSCKDSTLLMDKTALAAFNKFMTDFVAATGNQYLTVSDAYRTLADQEGKSIAPGRSDHHTGYLVAVKFVEEHTYTSDNSTKYSTEYSWLNDNAAKYGFVLRYPSSKVAYTGVSGYTYAYRYVGMAHAAYMSANNLCLEEYVELLKSSYKYSGEHLKITDSNGVKYEVYYIAEGEPVYVPASSTAFEVSGDNTGGFIVTVTLG